MTRHYKKSLLLSGVRLQYDTHKSIVIFRLLFFPLIIHQLFHFCSYLAQALLTGIHSKVRFLFSITQDISSSLPLNWSQYFKDPLSFRSLSLFLLTTLFTCVLSNSFPWNFDDFLLYFLDSLFIIMITAILMLYIQNKLISPLKACKIILSLFWNIIDINTVFVFIQSENWKKSRILYYYYKNCT